MVLDFNFELSKILILNNQPRCTLPVSFSNEKISKSTKSKIESTSYVKVMDVSVRIAISAQISRISFTARVYRVSENRDGFLSKRPYDNDLRAYRFCG